MSLMLKYKLYNISIFALIVFIYSCQKYEVEEGLSSNLPRYTIPAKLNDGWKVKSPVEAGIDTSVLYNLLDSIHQGVYGSLRSLLLVKDGHLVVEEYFEGWEAPWVHPLFSVTKSIASAAICIAIEKGFPIHTSQTIKSLFYEWDHINWASHHTQITLENMLSMTAGFEWEELNISYLDENNSHHQMIASEDWIQFVLESPVIHEPGQFFKYNTGLSNLLAVIIENSTGIRFENFLSKHLLKPLEINNYHWNFMNDRYAATGGSYGGIFMSARDMTKFGQLILDDGKWNQQSIMSKEWIEKSLRPYIYLNPVRRTFYGYQWWGYQLKHEKTNKNITLNIAVGFGGQKIFVMKDFNCVMSITSNPDTPGRTLQFIEAIDKFLIDAFH